MKIFDLKFLPAVLLLLLFVSCKSDVEVSQQHVAQVIRSLSADEMMGRDAMSESIHQAANIIASEFDNAGIQPLPGETNYMQQFTLFSMQPSESEVKVNGDIISEEAYFGMINDTEIIWDNGDYPVYEIKEQDAFRDKFRELTSDEQSSVIKIPDAHKKWFHRYRSYYTRSNRSLELGVKPNDIFILTNEPIRNYEIRIKNKVDELRLENVAGMIEGQRKDEIVLFSAHYDHIGVITPVNGDSIANGANDNASGVAAVVELARYFNKMPKPERTIYFVAFTAEEAGGYGSKYFSSQLDPDHITTMFNIEMIGKPATDRPNTAWITGFERTDFGEILQNSMPDSSFIFYPDPFPTQNLFFRSDNATLARLGVPAHTISTTPIDVDQDYHRVTDEFHTLNMSHITNTIEAIAQAAKVIISAEATPSRIPPNSLD